MKVQWSPFTSTVFGSCGYDHAYLLGNDFEEIDVEVDYECMREYVTILSVCEEFHCSLCELNLTDSREIEAAGLILEFESELERDHEYEPDYGND